MSTEKLRLAVLHARNVRRDFDRKAIRLRDPELNETMASLRHALDDVDRAACELEQSGAI